MRLPLQKLAARFDAFSSRERGMIAAAAIGGAIMIGFTLLVDPVSASNRNLRQSIERQNADAAGLQAQISLLEAQLRSDPDAGRKAEIQELTQAVRATSEQLEKLASALVPPERMNAVLESILKRNPGLRLVSFKTLAPSGLLASKNEKEGAPREFELFRHGVEIRLEGSFADLHAYLAQLEQGPQKLLWGEARLTVTEHPKAMLTLVVYTLNSDKAWLAI